jgi:hypothetical protein
MRACACDTASRLCVRTVLCRSAFSLVPPLRSTGSAAVETALFARFRATLGRSDFSIALIVGYGLRPSRQPPGHDWRGGRWRSPGSRAKGFCACQGLRRRGASMRLAISTRAVLPSVGRKTSAPRTWLTPLNTSPAHSPVNASRLPSRASRGSLGGGVVRYTFTVTDLHRLPSAGLPAHPSTTSELTDVKSAVQWSHNAPSRLAARPTLARRSLWPDLSGASLTRLTPTESNLLHLRRPMPGARFFTSRTARLRTGFVE